MTITFMLCFGIIAAFGLNAGCRIVYGLFFDESPTQDARSRGGHDF